jgi:CRP-like cAMP-binding protein
MQQLARRTRERLSILDDKEDSPTSGYAMIRSGRQPDIFARLTPGQRNKVIASGNYLRFPRGATLFAQGDRHRSVFLVERGLVKTCYTSPGGREITLAYWQPGNLVGTPQVIDTSTYAHMWSGIAVTDTSAIGFGARQIRELMEHMPALAIGVIETLEFKGKCLSALVQMLGTRSVAERLGLLLNNLAILHGEKVETGISIGRPFTHEVLAQMVGASRQWVTMTLDRFRKDGLIEIGKGRTVTLRPQSNSGRTRIRARR